MGSRKSAKYLEGTVVVGKTFMGVSQEEDFAVNEVFQTCIARNNGLLLVVDRTNARVAIFRVEGQTVVSLSANAIFSVTKDTASKINVYWETDNFKVQNKTSAALTLKAGLLGL